MRDLDLIDHFLTRMRQAGVNNVGVPAAAATRLRALLAEARAVLEPFATPVYGDPKRTGWSETMTVAAGITIADFRAVRALVARLKEEG